MENISQQALIEKIDFQICLKAKHFPNISFTGPVLKIGWQDPWESLELGRGFVNFNFVEDFIVHLNVGRCHRVSLSQNTQT